jgi:hypothetical protein
MKSLLIAIGISVVLFALILIGLFTGNATLASLSCLIGWTPAMIFVGWAFRGAGLRVTVSSNPEPVTHEPASAPIQRRPRSIGMPQ